MKRNKFVKPTFLSKTKFYFSFLIFNIFEKVRDAAKSLIPLHLKTERPHVLSTQTTCQLLTLRFIKG